MTPVTLCARSRHLILPRPFESFLHPSRACFRFRLLRPASRFRVPRRKSVPRTLLDPHLAEETRTGVPTRWCKQKRIEIQIGATCMKLDRRYSRTDSHNGKACQLKQYRRSRETVSEWLQGVVTRSSMGEESESTWWHLRNE